MKFHAIHFPSVNVIYGYFAGKIAIIESDMNESFCLSRKFSYLNVDYFKSHQGNVQVRRILDYYQDDISKI